MVNSVEELKPPFYYSVNNKIIPNPDLILNVNKEMPIVLGRYHLIKMLSHGKIIDIGCFDGKMFGESAVNVDIKDYGAPNFVKADAHDLSIFKDKEFDCAVLTEILEHVIDPVKVLKETKRIAKTVVISVPNEYEWNKIYKPFKNPEHVRTYKRDTIIEDVNKAGMIVTYFLKENLAGWSHFIILASEKPYKRLIMKRGEEIGNFTACETIAMEY